MVFDILTDEIPDLVVFGLMLLIVASFGYYHMSSEQLSEISLAESVAQGAALSSNEEGITVAYNVDDKTKIKIDEEKVQVRVNREGVPFSKSHIGDNSNIIIS